MKTQKEAVALRVQLEEIRKAQQEQMRKAREAQMEREGIPLDGRVNLLKNILITPVFETRMTVLGS